MSLSALEVRKLLFERKLKSEPVSDATIDSWESTDAKELAVLKGQVSLVEMRGSDTTQANAHATGSDGKIDGMTVSAFLIGRALVLEASRERVFTDADTDAIAAFGLTVLTPLSTAIVALSGLDTEAAAAARANFLPTPANGSNTSSVAPSVAEPIATGASA